MSLTYYDRALTSDNMIIAFLILLFTITITITITINITITITIVMIITRMEVALVQGSLVITIMMDRRETLVRAGSGLDDNG